MHESPQSKDSLRVRDVIAVVLFGVALGVLFNALQLADKSPRALAWRKLERTIVALEPGTPASAATADSARPTASTADTTRNAKPVTGIRANPRGATRPGRAAKPGGGARPAPNGAASRPSASPAAIAAPATLAPGTPPAANVLPVIADSREPREVGTDAARAFHAAAGALFVDARSKEEYEEGHIAGAINLPFDDVFKDPALAKSVRAGTRPVITYCGGGECDLSRNLAFSLIDAGLRKVLVYTGGMPAWKAAGASVNEGSQP